MIKRSDSTLRASIGRALAPTVWIVGAMVTALTWFASTPLWGVATLAATLVVTLGVARLAIGWRAVPFVFTILALFSPVLLLLGSAHLHRWVGSSGALGLDSNHHQQWYSFLWTFIASAVLASPSAFLLGLGEEAFARLRAVATRVVPVLVALALVVSAVAAVRLARRPSPEKYVASLPLFAVIPAVEGQPCLPISGEPAEHRSRWSDDQCVTEEVSGPPLSFHYHCYEGDRSRCRLVYRIDGGREDTIDWSAATRRSVAIHWDPSLNAYLTQDEEGRLVALDNRRWLSPVQLGSRVGPPGGWFTLAITGIGVALLGALASRLVRRLVDVSSTAHRQWLGRLRGDLALVAIGTVLATSALLVSSLLAALLP